MPTADRYQQYEVLRRADGSLWELGRGAMGITYKAYDTNLRFPVALKVINATYLESDTARQRFLREARAAAALRHPNVASVFNLGIENENYFYVMEFIDGETVEARVKRNGPLKPAEALNIALQVSRALAVAARQQLVHRDLKPTNLMLVDQEEELLVKVIDFGLAKVTKDAGEDSGALTMGGFVGTPHFASPEQVEEGDVDIRSDIYSLGATLYFVLTGQSPFSGSIGQIMSQHLYKPLPMEPLSSLPWSVASLIQRMMEKDRNVRPQTAQELQKSIVACLLEIRDSPGATIQKPDEETSAWETVDLTFASGQPLAAGVTLARTYKLLEELSESPQGRKFLADDLRHNRRVHLLVLSPEFLADSSSLSALQEAVSMLRKAPHKMLREVYSFETFSDCSFLVEEFFTGTSLLDLLRRRGALTAPEVSRLLTLLAPVADHASRCGLRHLDLALPGIHLMERTSTRSGIPPDVLRRPLTAWETPTAKVDSIDFSFSPDRTGTWTGMATRVQGPAEKGPTGSYVRLLSLLAYELLGGPRARLDASGQYTPVATLSREGNAVLRRGVIDEFPSARELSTALAATVGAAPSLSAISEIEERVAQEPVRRTPSSVPLPSESKGRVSAESLRRTPSSVPSPSDSKERAVPVPIHRAPPPKTPSEPATKRQPKFPAWLWALAFGALALVGVSLYLVLSPRQIQEIAALSIRTEPAGASVLLDGKSPQASPDTFTHVPFGSHQLSATLDNYEPVNRDVQVREGMNPEIHLPLKPIQEIPSLSIRTDQPGASILLDGKSPQVPPNTFTHVPFGPHQLSVTLDNFEPLKQEIQVRRGMNPEIHLPLKPMEEIPSLSIRTEPPGAAILLDGKPPQVPPNTFTHVPFGSHQLSATLDSYEPVKQDIQVHKGVSELRLQLKPLPDLPSLTVQTDPSGASILLDGKPPQVPPNTFTHVPFGSHQISAALDSYEPFKQDIQVRRGMSSEVRLQLKAIQDIPSLSVLTEPLGASILLDGRPPQVSPDTFTHVPFGSHQITATLDDYEPLKQDIQVRRGMSPEIRLQLKAIQDIPSLTVLTEPSGASILLDGKPPQVPPNTFTHVPFGPHQLSATLDNYEQTRHDIQVRKGMSPEIRLELKQSLEIAALAVQTEPTGASILLDGKPPQVPPSTFTHVPFGPHQITATLEEYEPLKQDIQVRRGMSSEIRLQFRQIQDIPALSIQADPSSAAVLLDGMPPQQLPGTFTHVRFGKHRLSAFLEGYEPFNQDLQVSESMDPTIPVKLHRRAIEVAALTIQSEPAGASILLDGAPPQQPPATFTHVLFGQHQLTAYLDGYEPVTQDLQLNESTESPLPVKLLQSNEASPEFLIAYMRFVRALKMSNATNIEEHLKKLDQIVNALRTKTPPLSREEFQLSYKDSVVDAANFDILSAFLLLGEKEPDQEAMQWFMKAAELKKDSYAMMKVGRLFLKKRTPEDNQKGFEWLNRAYSAPAPNLEAGAFLGECYLTGRGTNPDPQKAKEIIMPLAGQSVIPAMVLAGNICQDEAEDKQAESERSTGPARQALNGQVNNLFHEAREWWEKGAEKNDYNAIAHIGRMYEKGLDGFEKSEKEAEKRYKDGVSHGNALSKLYYALFLIEKRPSRFNEAKQLMSESAAVGFPTAIKWCEDNHVPYNKSSGE